MNAHVETAVVPSSSRRGLSAPALWTVTLCTAVCGSCRSEDGHTVRATPASRPAPAATASATELSGLDSCLVGSWTVTRTTLKTKALTAEGGANMVMVVSPDGLAAADYTHASAFHAKSTIETDYTYSGKGQAVMHTPRRGSVTWDKADISGIRVTATANVPGVGRMPIFKDKPLSELAAMGSALAQGLAKAAQPRTASGAGMGNNPVFSAESYTCDASALTLKATQAGVEWVFARTGK
jgi:hypothetical protein